ncbi:MAG: hypothetical protein EOM20_12800 [Spartobacteria bacterium]|nr:hypothetical protein [Spartobacteria bacterium]
MLKSLEEIAPGMVVASDVTVKGLTLVRAGVALTPEHILALQKWKVSSVDLVGTEEEEAGGGQQADIKIDREKYDKQAARVESLFAASAGDDQLSLLKACVFQAYRELYRVE